MSLYQNSVLNKYLKRLETAKVNAAWEKFTAHFHNPTIQENIRNAKEEQYQEGFLIDLFINVLGYTKNPNPNFNLTTELKNVKGAKKTDGAILKDGKALAVIELKGTNTTNLTKVEDQAFGYKNNQPGCVYVITSNFEKLRFYIENTVDFEEFNLFQLTKERFEVLWLCLSNEYLLENKPKQIKDESLKEEKDITERLYKDYSLFRNELFASIQKNNPTYDKLTLFKKTQKLLDRFLFLLFAEDRLLIEPNSVSIIVNEWTTLRDEFDEYQPLYSRFKKHFGYLNTGHKSKKHDIFAYNGGLFEPDDILDNIKIDDALLYKHTLILTKYNFVSQVSVNILGHIFEHSLSYIEEIQAEIAGVATDKSESKQKKDGVFYTPKYITKYIVDNTVGRLCQEKKTELGIDETEYEKGRKHRKKATLKALVQNIDEYRAWLLQVTICDPACGSGAFLNQALEFLISEHRYIDELKAKLLGGTMVLSEVENTILENNLFGVDINQESVEIAKLSLWLSTAKKGRELTTLNNNIKCGNSLIDDPRVAGNKAFNWKKEFPHVFEKGGFDVVIGNPPYVGEKGNTSIFEALKKVPKWKKYYRRRSNTYYFFIKLGMEILMKNGIQSLIIPREFTNADWANKVRKEITDHSKVISIVDFNDVKVFENVGTTSLILTQQKEILNEDKYQFKLMSISEKTEIMSKLLNEFNFESISSDLLGYEGLTLWNFHQTEINLSVNIVQLKELFDVSQGLVTGADKVTNKHIIANLIDESYLNRGIFIIKKDVDYKIEGVKTFLNINNEWVELSAEDMAFIKPFVKTENLKKWFVSQSNLFVLYVGNRALSKNIREYLKQFSGVLLNRSTTLPKGEKISLSQFEKFELSDIKEKYSSAGAVQKIMKSKKWYLPLYERVNIPFEFEKIIVNTKNMDKFTFSNRPAYSSGGGGGGQNFIYPRLENAYWKEISLNTNKNDFTLFINAVLNSSIIQEHIKTANFNQLSIEKIQELPIIKINFDTPQNEQYQNAVSIIQSIIKLHQELLEANKQLSTYMFSLYPKITETFNGEWFTLALSDFIKLINEASTKKISKSEEFDWSLFFEQKIKELLNYAEEIQFLELKLDKIIGDLFKLNR